MTPIREYKNNQIILSSERIIFNTITDNIILSSKQDIALSAEGSIHLNIGNSSNGSSSKNFLIINAPKIQFGLQNVQPVPKGDDLEKLINDLLTALSNLASSLTSATGIGVGTVTEPTVNAAGTKLQQQIQNLQQKVSNIKSQVTFTS